jgi:hypothetical protein
LENIPTFAPSINNDKAMQEQSEYTLHLSETTRKTGRFLYEVKDASGNVISQRFSNNPNYVAATISGSFYFGRIDLIGKGDHGKRVKWCIENGIEQKPIAYKKTA